MTLTELIGWIVCILVELLRPLSEAKDSLEVKSSANNLFFFVNTNSSVQAVADICVGAPSACCPFHFFE